jgi:catalase
MASLHSYGEKIDGHKIRARSPSFADHFSQATLFWNSMADWEKTHIVDALSFELNMCEVEPVKQRVLDELLVNVSEELVTRVAKNIGMTVKAAPKASPHSRKSSALSMDKPATSIKGRKVAVLAADGTDASHVRALMTDLKSKGAIAHVIAKTAGMIQLLDGTSLKVNKPAPNAASVIYDAVFVPGGSGAVVVAQSGVAVHFVTEAYAHGKPVAGVGEGIDVLTKAQIPAGAAGVTTGQEAEGVVKEFTASMLKHRFPHRDIDSVPV